MDALLTVSLVLRLRLLALLAVTVVLQGTLGSLQIYGVHPDFMLLFVVSVGLVSGPVTAATVGFVVGIVTDLLVGTPFGLSALTDVLVGYAVGSIGSSLEEPSAALVPVLALLASAGGVVLYAIGGDIFGQSQMLHDGLLRIAIVVAVVNALLALPSRRVLAWAMPTRAVR